MDVLRTPDERFADLPGWPYAPLYLEQDGLRSTTSTRARGMRR
jgi:haloalkane dehalogenase